MKRRIVSVVGGLLLTLLAAAPCLERPAVAAQGPQGKALEKIVVADPSRGESWMPVYLASTLGFFREQGLEVSFVSYQGGPLVIASLLAGDSQFALTGYEQVLKTFEKGKSTKMLAATSARHPWCLISAPGIKSVADLKGKRVGGGMPGSSPRGFVRACVKYGGLDQDKDVTYTDLIRGSEIAALSKGDVAALFAYGSLKQQLLEHGGKMLVDLSDPAMHKKVLGSDSYPLYVVQATDQFIKEKPETVQRFMNAVAKAMAWENKHKAQEIAEKLLPLFPNADKAVFPKVIADTKLTLSRDGSFNRKGHDAATRLSLDAGLLSKPVPMEDVVDESFLKKAHAKYGK